MISKRVVALGIVLALAMQVPAWAGLRSHAAVNAMNASFLSPGMVFASWDADKDKKLTPGEFNAGWARMERAAAVRQLKAQFDRQDENKSGVIDPAEYATLELIRKAGAAAPPIVRFDSDKSGGLDFKEYVALVTAMVAKAAPAPGQPKDALPAK